jgi:ribosomal protein S18 acetylase RimI-like enzyme
LIAMTADWALRPVAAGDEALLLQVFASTRAEELALSGWDPALCEAFVRQQSQAQQMHYQRHWPNAEHSVIEWLEGDGAARPAGRLWLHRDSSKIHVLDIAILPEWRGQGLGGAVMGRLLAEGAASGREVSIFVETHNPARRLYERLGFAAVGELEGVHQYMVRRPVENEILESCHEQA